MKVCITGGAGMIGSHLAELLVAAQAQVTIIDNLERGNLFNLLGIREKVKIKKRDLRRESISLDGFDIVFHLAAKVSGIHFNRTHQLEMMLANLEINTNVCRAAMTGKPKLFVNISTACVYPHDAPVPTPESCAEVCNPEPTNFGYGVAKWVGEQQAKYLYKEFGIPTLIVRLSNAFGPRDYYDEATSHVAPALIRRIVEGQNPLVVWGSGNQSRVLVDCRDIAKYLLALALCGKAADGLPVNIGHPDEVTIKQLVGLICEMTGKRPEVQFDITKPEGYPRRAPDMTRLKSLLGDITFRPIQDTLMAMLTDYKQQVALGLVSDLAIGTFRFRQKPRLSKRVNVR